MVLIVLLAFGRLISDIWKIWKANDLPRVTTIVWCAIERYQDDFIVGRGMEWRKLFCWDG